MMEDIVLGVRVEYGAKEYGMDKKIFCPNVPLTDALPRRVPEPL